MCSQAAAVVGLNWFVRNLYWLFDILFIKGKLFNLAADCYKRSSYFETKYLLVQST